MFTSTSSNGGIAQVNVSLYTASEVEKELDGFPEYGEPQKQDGIGGAFNLSSTLSPDQCAELRALLAKYSTLLNDAPRKDGCCRTPHIRTRGCSNTPKAVSSPLLPARGGATGDPEDAGQWSHHDIS